VEVPAPFTIVQVPPTAPVIPLFQFWLKSVVTTVAVAVNVELEPRQIELDVLGDIVIAVGITLPTVTTTKTEQPVDGTVAVIEAVPTALPVTRPVLEPTDAIPDALDVHVRPATASVS